MCARGRIMGRVARKQTLLIGTASIFQCFMTKHCEKIEERDTLLFTILFNKKDKYHTALFLSFLCQDMI